MFWVVILAITLTIAGSDCHVPRSPPPQFHRVVKRAITNGTNDTGNVTDAMFPAKTFLGNGINIFDVQPFDIVNNVPGADPWTVPVNVNCDTSSSSSSSKSRLPPPAHPLLPKLAPSVSLSLTKPHSAGTFEHWDTGYEAAQKLAAGGSLGIRYEAISGDVSVDSGISQIFQEYFAYALFDYSSRVLDCTWDQWAHSINVATLKRILAIVPAWREGDAAILERYRDLFGLVGTHVVTHVNYGSRLSISSWADNSDEAVLQNFSANVDASFGFIISGDVQAHAKDTESYHTFSKSFQKSVGCHGGDQVLAGKIMGDPTGPDVGDNYKAWLDTTRERPDLTGIGVDSLDLVLLASLDPELMSRAADVKNAFQYLTKHPKTHRTNCTMIVNSDWGAISLLSPSATVEEVQGGQVPPDVTAFGETKLSWYSTAGTGRTVENQRIEYVFFPFLPTHSSSS
ncbi:uncharacterized protein KY384_001247 [Bacidia gigantensis]|uniref:uncharacterized protein n=1 Tax=Bacidia gigantensis TaxID=2732470 RepID=UPI001D05B782|nr:uncharacterized protein KY384_001247 [Bacidia gigantensis]KAG8534402.1 hypothetical protein KY384_001247 [Bacidia gigantensis]